MFFNDEYYGCNCYNYFHVPRLIEFFFAAFQLLRMYSPHLFTCLMSNMYSSPVKNFKSAGPPLGLINYRKKERKLSVREKHGVPCSVPESGFGSGCFYHQAKLV